uniref:Uncharacterized protein n=1 Tax=Plectus sambesii TaxID=2011161 RepID=A0A914VZF9_9BILA
MLLLQLAAVSLVMMACTSEELDATIDCGATENDIFVKCFSKPEHMKSFTQFTGHMGLFNMRKVTTILKKLKNIGCIKASAWPDIQTWITLNTPPQAYIRVFKNLSKGQKKIIWNSRISAMNQTKNENLEEKLQAVYTIVKEKLGNLSDAHRNKVDEWIRKFYKTCLPDFYDTKFGDD